MELGWGQGTTEHFYLETIASILKKLIEFSNIPNKKTLFYGSSAGGFQSLYLAGYFKDSRVLVNNPQTNVLKYKEKLANKMLKISYKDLSREEIQERYSERLDIASYYRSINYIPKIEYYQNLAAEHDIPNHLTPFFEEIKTMDFLNKKSRVSLHLYYDKAKGHDPFPKEETLKIINYTLKKLN